MQLGLNLGFSPSSKGSGSGGSGLNNKFWTRLSSTVGKVISNFNLTFFTTPLFDESASPPPLSGVGVQWGDGTASFLTSGAGLNKTLGETISIEIKDSNAVVTAINCGTSSPRLGGTVDISAFTNLNSFRCVNNDITIFTGNTLCPQLTTLDLSENKLTSFPSLTNMPLLQELRLDYNTFTGSIPSLNSLTSLVTVRFNENTGITGNIPSLSLLTNLESFYCIACNLTGAIPSLAANTALRDFRCDSQGEPYKLTGSIPSLATNTQLRVFHAHNNNLSGSIPSLSGLDNLRDFRCFTNQLTGSIPSLSGLTNLKSFRCFTNQLTGSIPSLSGLTNLRDFYCHANQLTGSIPSLSGLTQLWVFYCHTNQLTGSIPSLSGLTNLQGFYCHTNQLTGFDGGSVSNTLGDFRADNNLLTSAAVNAILAAFEAAGRTSLDGTCILNLGGTGNAAPTGQGITDKATLQSRGWTVTTN